MYRYIVWIKCVPFVGVLLSCGENAEKNSKATNPGNLPIEYQVIESDSTIIATESGIRGEGELVFVNPLTSIDSNNHFIIQFRLKAGGHVGLTMFANKELKGGIELRVERLNETDQKTVISAEHAGVITKDVSKYFVEGFNGKMNQDLSLRVDMHNGEPKGHIIAWTVSPSVDLTWQKKELNDVVGANGTGVFWGLILKDAEILNVEIREAVDSHSSGIFQRIVDAE